MHHNLKRLRQRFGFWGVLFVLSFCFTPEVLRAQSLGDALNTNLTWTTGGTVYIMVPYLGGFTAQYLDPSWTAETNVSLDGLAAQSAGPVNQSGAESWIQTSTTNSGYLFFSWKANLGSDILAPSTHQGSKLELYLNNNLEQTQLHTFDWTPQFLYCDGASNTVRWRQAWDPGYWGDNSQDTTWLDEVTFVADPMAPQIWSQPAPQLQKVAVGTTVTISATGIGTPPLFYQWMQNGTNVSGATNATLTLTNATLDQAGAYSVTVSNASGGVLSSNATLQVVPLMPLNKIAQWPGYERSASQSVAVNGNLVYVGNEDWNTYAALLVLDASDPANPVLVGKMEGTQHGFNYLRMVGNYIYAGMDSGGGLSVLDVSNPLQPQVVTNLSLGYISDLKIAGNYAYAVSYYSGLVILDISNPTQPVPVSTNAPICFEQGVSVVGNYAYVVGRCNGNLAVLDISDRTNPVVMGTVGLDGPGDFISVTNNTAYIGTWNNLQVVDVSNPTNPVPVTSLPGYITGFSGNYAFVSSGFSLSVLDISTPTNPVPITSLNLGDYLENLEIVGNRLYVPNWQNGLMIVDISNPAAPAILGTYASGGESEGVDVSGNLAFLSDSKGGLQIFDISTPANPVPLGRYWTPSDNGAVQSKVVGNLDYVAYNSAGLVILDVSDPLHPLLKGACTNVAARWVDVTGHYAYVGGGFSGLQVVDVSNPAQPIVVTQTNITPSGDTFVKIAGNYAYLVPWYENNVMVADISNPANPVEVSDNIFAGQPWNLFVSGNLLVGGGVIGDISNPTNPIVAGQYNDNGYVECASNIAFVADGYGLSAFDFSVPPSVELGHSNLVGWSQALKIAGQYAFVADDDWGLQVFQLPTNFITAPSMSPWPVSQIVFAGANIVLGANAGGQPPMSYQWYLNGAPVSGETNSFVAFPNIQPGATGTYSVVVSNSAGAATNQTTLTVIVRPDISVGGTNAFGMNASEQFQFSFATQLGAEYAVEYVNSLSDTNWKVLTNVWGNDSFVPVVDPNTTDTSRFYRVRKE
jgi:hypothetical protein